MMFRNTKTGDHWIASFFASCFPCLFAPFSSPFLGTPSLPDSTVGSSSGVGVFVLAGTGVHVEVGVVVDVAATVVDVAVAVVSVVAVGVGVEVEASSETTIRT